MVQSQYCQELIWQIHENMPHNVSRFTRSQLNNKSTGIPSTGIPSTLIDDDDDEEDFTGKLIFISA
jgi:hypothetical protein